MSEETEPVQGKEQKNLLDVLLHRGLMSSDQLNIVKVEHKISGGSLEDIVTELGFITEDTLVAILGELRNSTVVSLQDFSIPTELWQRIPQKIFALCTAVPLSYDTSTKTLTVAMADVGDLQAYDHLRRYGQAGESLVAVTAKKSEILNLLQSREGKPDPQGSTQTSLSFSSSTEDHPMEGLLSSFLLEAVRNRASDIHFSPEKYFITVRHRCDGLLKSLHSFHISLWTPLCIQLKVLSGMDITETRKPQDGRFSLSILGRTIDIRVSSHITIHGENFVLRILDKKHSHFSMQSLGYTPEVVSQLRNLLHRPDGMVIFTGPTGCGKTTTLYSLVRLLDAEKLNIMTLEEPVEYELPNIRQSDVRENSALTFVGGVRSILRQDPDVILLGEIRDAETAQMAIRASMTGHKVLTTLHTTQALGAIYRFMEFQIPLSFVISTLKGVMAQRLIRILCPTCKEKVILSEKRAKQIKVWPHLTVYQAKGCSLCQFEGYKGRTSVTELVILTEELGEMILAQKPLSTLEQHLRDKGVPSLLLDGLEAVKAGDTSLEEIDRVIGL